MVLRKQGDIVHGNAPADEVAHRPEKPGRNAYRAEGAVLTDDAFFVFVIYEHDEEHDRRGGREIPVRQLCQHGKPDRQPETDYCAPSPRFVPPDGEIHCGERERDGKAVVVHTACENYEGRVEGDEGKRYIKRQPVMAEKPEKPVKHKHRQGGIKRCEPADAHHGVVQLRAAEGLYFHPDGGNGVMQRRVIKLPLCAHVEVGEPAVFIDILNISDMARASDPADVVLAGVYIRFGGVIQPKQEACQKNEQNHGNTYRLAAFFRCFGHGLHLTYSLYLICRAGRQKHSADKEKIIPDV